MSVVKINEEKCNGCSFCVNDCPGACLYLDNDKAHVHDNGFFITCTRLSRRLRKVIRLPKGQKAVTCMIIGYPAVKYQRIVPRKGIKSFPCPMIRFCIQVILSRQQQGGRKGDIGIKKTCMADPTY